MSPELGYLCECVGRMPRRVRRVVALCKVYGYTQMEIAICLHLTPQEVEHDMMVAVRAMASATDDLPGEY